MEHIIDTLKLNHPDMTSERLQYHANQLRKLFAAAHDKCTPLYFAWFKNELAILNQISEMKEPHYYIPSLIRLFPRNRHYRNMLLIDGRKRKKSFEDIESEYTSLSEDIAPILEYNGLIGQHDYIRLQDYAIVSLLCGIWIPVYRASDISSLKIRHINRVVDNFYDGNVIAFQKPVYDEIVVPDGLRHILDKLIQHTPYDYLFMNGEDRLSIQRFNYVVTKCFGIGIREILKTRLDYFPMDSIPDFHDDTT